MARDCNKLVGLSPLGDVELTSWDMSDLETASQLTVQAYEQTIDRQISFHYQSLQGCRNFLGGIVEKPGCGRFMKDASFALAPLDGRWSIYSCFGCVASQRHIPQILVSQRFQGKGSEAGC
jgi:hypothetical protein